MSNGWNLELSSGKDGRVYLSFWDSLHGDDRLFILNPDGTAVQQKRPEADAPIEVPVNLTEALRDLCAWLERGGK